MNSVFYRPTGKFIYSGAKPDYKAGEIVRNNEIFAPEFRKYAEKNLANYGNVVRHISDAPTAVARWDIYKLVDILFVDGRHETAQVMIDINSWFGFLHDRSVVFLHDAQNGNPYYEVVMLGAASSKLFTTKPKWRQRYDLQAGSLAAFSR